MAWCLLRNLRLVFVVYNFNNLVVFKSRILPRKWIVGWQTGRVYSSNVCVVLKKTLFLFWVETISRCKTSVCRRDDADWHQNWETNLVDIVLKWAKISRSAKSLEWWAESSADGQTSAKWQKRSPSCRGQKWQRRWSCLWSKKVQFLLPFAIVFGGF